MIADRIVVPTKYHQYYTEKLAYLSNCYMPHDSKRQISDRVFTREELGLPATGFIFCCFNNIYKIMPQTFDSWMRILRDVDNSVILFSAADSTAISNLQKEASVRGVNPGRLVFAQRLPLLSDHLARHRAADLFLDTSPYNAHTTSIDALWSGLPVLTCMGETFASRVAASQLNAIGLPELITMSQREYESRAVELATHPDRLGQIKQKLVQNRLTTPLFDTPLFTKHIEMAFMAMYKRYQANLPPDHIHIEQ